MMKWVIKRTDTGQYYTGYPKNDRRAWEESLQSNFVCVFKDDFFGDDRFAKKKMKEVQEKFELDCLKLVEVKMVEVDEASR
jgi:hypothetical protein